MAVAWDYLALLAVSTLALLGLVYLFWRMSSIPRTSMAGEIYTVVRCGDGVERKRKYQDGDYVGRAVADCAGGVVVGIYKEVSKEE